MNVPAIATGRKSNGTRNRRRVKNAADSRVVANIERQPLSGCHVKALLHENKVFKMPGFQHLYSNGEKCKLVA